jgi:hypothetical protein
VLPPRYLGSVATPEIAKRFPLCQSHASWFSRLQKAINSLVEGSMTIILTRQTPTEIRALNQTSRDRYTRVVTLNEGKALSERFFAALRMTWPSGRIVKCTNVMTSGLVKNGDGKEYEVILTESLTACSCKDALYRGGICKHGVAVALYVLHTPQPKTTAPATQFSTFHLMWRYGIVLCDDPHPRRVQVWPWTEYMLTWPEVCSACVAAYKQPKTIMVKAA